jgi:hypothetical protein
MGGVVTKAKTKKTTGGQLVVKRGGVPPAVYLMHVSDKEWECFIEEACRQRTIDGKPYASVKILGNANDKGRDVEARLKPDLAENQWDLYQAKHYGHRLTPADAFPELVKFFLHLEANSYPRPRKYYFCAPQNLGPTLHDLVAAPDEFKKQFLNAWHLGKQGLGGAEAKLTPTVEALVQAFDFARIEECQVHDLLDWHANNGGAHFALFGIEPERGDDPDVPHSAVASELTYVNELLRVYSEHGGTELTLDDVTQSSQYGEHLFAARCSFYSAEGLRRFSRDIYQDDEFSKLLAMVKNGVRLVVASPRLTTGLDRHDAAVEAASKLTVTDSVLHPRLRGGDLPGACHHLVNEKQLFWVRK